METLNTDNNELCFYLHEYVKEDLNNHVRSTHWRPITDKEYISKLKLLPQLPKYIRLNNQHQYEIDITDCWFYELPPSFQNEYFKIANILEKMNNENNNLVARNTNKQQAKKIHQAWLLNNSECFWEKTLDLSKPFDQLSSRAQYFFKISSSINTKINRGANKVCVAETVHALLNELELNSMRQVNTMLEFNGQRFYPKLDNEQTVYYKLTGLTKDEYEKQLEIARRKAYCSFETIEANSFVGEVMDLMQSSKSDYEIIKYINNKKASTTSEMPFYVAHSITPELMFYTQLISLTYDDTSRKKRVEEFRIKGSKAFLFEQKGEQNAILKQKLLTDIERQNAYF